MTMMMMPATKTRSVTLVAALSLLMPACSGIPVGGQVSQERSATAAPTTTTTATSPASIAASALPVPTPSAVPASGPLRWALDVGGDTGGVVLGSYQYGSLPELTGTTLGLVEQLTREAQDGGILLVVGNPTAQFARDVEVVVDGQVIATAPTTLQPGELFPLILAPGVTTLAALARATVTGTLSELPDPARAIFISGLPGIWRGQSADFQGIPGMVELPSGTFNYFESALEIQQPTSHPDVEAPAGLVGLRVVAGDLTDGVLSRVRELPVLDFDGATITAATTEPMAFSGMIVDGTGVAFWAWIEQP